MDQVASELDFDPWVGVIIPTHNRWRMAEASLASLFADDYPNKTVYLIDDGSVDDTSRICHEKYPQVIICRGDGNLWWSGAINLGVRQALADKVDLILWLNDDNFVEKSTIREMVEAHQICGPRSIIAARTLSTATRQDEWAGHPPRWHTDYGQWSPPSVRTDERKSIAPHSPTLQLEHPPGGRGVLFPITCFMRVGLIDQKSFPHYWADHDFHYRAMKAGFEYHLAERAGVWNRPNNAGKAIDDQFTLRWCWFFLFSRRSSMNLPTLHRLLRRHLTVQEYRRIWYPLLGNTLLWLTSGWVNRHPRLHQTIRGGSRMVNLIRGGPRQ